MAIEVELKLAVSPRDLRDARRLPWLKNLTNGPVSRKNLVSVYFDTSKFKLRNNGLTLRVRSGDHKRLQTIKSNNNCSNGVLGRDEWEVEIAGDEPDLKLAKDTPLAPLLTPKLKKSLRPVFETHVRRISVPVYFGSSNIEIAFDRGYIKTDARDEQISEIELELKKGDRADLAQLSERIARSIPTAYGALTKPERGYALSASADTQPVFAEKIALAPTVSTGDAFSLIGLSCLHHMAANENAARNGHSEGVHQMRVGLRRLRATISVFKNVVQSADAENVNSGLKWLTERLGPARDFDVLVKETVGPLREANPDHPEIALLEADLAERRLSSFENASAAVAGERYRTVVFETALWLLNGDWSRNADLTRKRDQPVTEFARDALAKRKKKIVKKIGKVARLDARQRHKVRIAVKKLRYATDYFRSLFAEAKAKKARKRFDKTLKSLQDALGKLNDISVHERLARQYIHPSKQVRNKPEKAYAMGFLSGGEKNISRVCLTSAANAGAKLSQLQPFWR